MLLFRQLAFVSPQRFVVHPMYSNRSLYEFDFALWKMVGDVDIASYFQVIRPICLPTNTVFTGAKVLSSNFPLAY